MAVRLRTETLARLRRGQQRGVGVMPACRWWGLSSLHFSPTARGVTAVPERVRSTCNAKVLGSIPEVLQKDLVRGNCSACPDGRHRPSCVQNSDVPDSPQA
eukprot:3979911-Prymnesium_polylepis.1